MFVLSKICPSTQLSIERDIWGLEGTWTSPEVPGGLGYVAKGSSAPNKRLLGGFWKKPRSGWTLVLFTEGSKRIARGWWGCAMY